MKNYLLRKGIVVGVLVLFIGAVFLPVIGDDVVNKEFSRKNEYKVLKKYNGVNDYEIKDTVGLWHFEEGAGDMTNDSSVYRNNGTCHQTQWTNDTPDGSDYAITFQSFDNSYVKIEDDPSLDFDDLGEDEGLMIDFWMKKEKTPVDHYAGLISKVYNDGGYSVRINTSNFISFLIHGDGAGNLQLVGSETQILDNSTWHHIVCVWFEETLYLYIDDMENPDATKYVGDYEIGDTSKWLDIGNDWPTDDENPFDGKIDEVQISIIQKENGNTLYVGGSGPGNYTYIQDAIDNASEGDTVYVFNGTYDENIIIDKPLDLIGENKETTFINGNNTGDDVVRIYYTTNVTVDGFTIKNSGSINNYDSGIEVYHSDYNVITNNIITSNFRGIWYYDCDFNIFLDNIVESNNISGILLRVNSEYNQILNNTISSNHIGLYCSESDCNEITGNEISLNDEDGIYIVSSNNNTILDNAISENWYGIRMWDSNNNNVCENTICQIDYYGISLSQSSNINQIYNNNMVNNSYQCWDECDNAWNDTYPWGGNYWNDFNEDSEGAYDNDSDGIVDSPYIIPGDGNRDFYPLKYPWGEHNPVANFTYYANNRTFDASLSYDRDGDIVFYGWDFNDGTTGQGKKVVHAYDVSATFDVTLTTKDEDGHQTSITKRIEVIGNNPPDAPNIYGPNKVSRGETYIFSFKVTDSNTDDIYYYIDWGDETVEGWLGPYESGEMIYLNHSWDLKGNYFIKAKAKDIYDAEGEWSFFEVTVPKNKHFMSQYNLIYRLFEWFPNAFAILEYLLGK